MLLQTASDVSATAAFGGIAIMIILFWLVMIGISIAATIFWVWMLIDAIQRKFPNENDKVLWILVILLAGGIGAIIYYFVVKHQK